jgi:aspartyl-tRNA(Asn)/glutamyl-tRNA(Gln) amidotransferase subunit A
MGGGGEYPSNLTWLRHNPRDEKLDTRRRTRLLLEETRSVTESTPPTARLPGVFITDVEPEADGIRLAVKDLFDTAGVRTTYGSAIFAEHIPAGTAEAVGRLQAAGYTSVGKANLHEFAWGITSENPHYGRVPNPLAADRIAGGSSGGCAAALAAGLADAALGSDSGGSIRIPAACCGVTGFKPSFGLVPTNGCFPLAPSFDHVGPMARDVAGCEAMMQVLVPGFAASSVDALSDLKVGVAWTDNAGLLVRGRVAEAAALFSRTRALDLPLPDGIGPAFSREAAEVHADLWREQRHLYGENVAYKLDLAMRISDAEVAAALRARERYRERLDELMSDVDLVLTPTLAMVAPRVGPSELSLREAMLKFTYPWNVIGAPALAVPCGPADQAMPASLQLVGRAGDDQLVLRAGMMLEPSLAAMWTE